MTRTVKIAVAGTHSTGKTTFMEELKRRMINAGLNVAYVHDSAAEARAAGFPILRCHTFESTAWLIAQAIRLETVAALEAAVILIDRPVPDAFGYLIAALRTTGRSIDQDRLSRLEGICEAWVKEYDLIFVTRLDKNIPIGQGRDDDNVFRAAADEAVAEVFMKLAPEHQVLTSANSGQSMELAMRFASGK
ncbi:AAA family ATPase [Pseudooceanicola sp.]|uniref:AAA family ATPase n=1 Tax=Pseudooceanicola sp. TaxID=1914328 RepID=UPI0040590CCA